MLTTKNGHIAPVLPAIVLAASFGLGLAPGLRAADDASQPLSGSFTFGWRSVDVGGAETKYKQHVNLDDGARLFGLDLKYHPVEGFADEVTLGIDHLGGDPFESIDFSMRKYGHYKFEMGRRKNTYFYDDLILPVALENTRLSNGGDFHILDFDRVRDFASLEIRVNPRAKLDFSYDRFSKLGEGTTTLDLQREEYELDRKIDEKMDQFGVDFQYRWDKATLVLGESVRKYDNAQEIFLPGQSFGANPSNADILDFYFLDQPTDYTSHDHRLALNLKPVEKLMVRLSASLQNLDLDTHAEEHSAGIGFNGQPYTTSPSGDGQISRDHELYDVDLSYLITSRVALIAGLRRHHLDQEGRLPFGGTDAESKWDIETTGGDLGVELSLTSELTLTVGVRDETRDVERTVEGDTDKESTDQTGYFASVGWRPSKIFRLQLELEDSTYDDPFTLSSPTDRKRLRLQGQANLRNGAYFTGTYLANRVDNDNVDWNADFDSLAVRGGYRHGKLDFSLGYTFIDVQRDVDQHVDAGGTPLLFPIFFESNADLYDGRLQWHALSRLDLGADLRWYKNDGDFGIDRSDLRFYANVDVGSNYLVYVSLRTIDYEETDRHYNDYDADILELGVGYRF